MSDLLDRLVDAYNRKDLPALVGCYAHDAEIYKLGDNEPLLHGASQVHDLYRKAFAEHPDLRTEVLERVAVGSVVVDKERLVAPDGTARMALVIYRLERGVIAQSWFAEG